ncbi:MAG: SURF1 family protein [Actinobacteria bacterium]|nr:SURF1 family protein [Actinomycetota bacterium]
MMNQSKGPWLKNSGFVAVVVVLALVFIRLGFWQLDRANELRELQKPYVEKPIVALSDVAAPSENLRDSAINRVVEFSGQYVAQFDAPGQVDNENRVQSWLVGLLEVNGGGAILVVRGTQAEELPKGEVFVKGRLMVRQFEDRAPKSEDQLSRLDPSLLVATYNLPVYDGYVVAKSEVLNGKPLNLKRAQVDPVKPKVPGYYWQHISYVVIWWLMALVVVFLPFYSRQREKKAKGSVN